MNLYSLFKHVKVYEQHILAGFFLHIKSQVLHAHLFMKSYFTIMVISYISVHFPLQ